MLCPTCGDYFPLGPDFDHAFFVIIVYVNPDKLLDVHTCFAGPRSLSEACAETVNFIEKRLNLHMTHEEILKGNKPEAFKPTN